MGYLLSSVPLVLFLPWCCRRHVANEQGGGFVGCLESSLLLVVLSGHGDVALSSRVSFLCSVY